MIPTALVIDLGIDAWKNTIHILTKKSHELTIRVYETQNL